MGRLNSLLTGAMVAAAAVATATLVLGRESGGSGRTGAAMLPTSATARDPAPLKIATCDVYGVTDSLIKSDRFMPDIKADEERIKKELEPLEKALQEMAEKLRAMTPQDQEAQALYGEFQKKQKEGQEMQRRLSAEHDKMVGRKYIEAYKLVKASCETVAKDLGYSHVVASRTKEEIMTDNPALVAQALLARVMVVSPEGTDITDDVKKDLKLD